MLIAFKAILSWISSKSFFFFSLGHIYNLISQVQADCAEPNPGQSSVHLWNIQPLSINFVVFTASPNENTVNSAITGIKRDPLAPVTFQRHFWHPNIYYLDLSQIGWWSHHGRTNHCLNLTLAWRVKASLTMRGLLGWRDVTWVFGSKQPAESLQVVCVVCVVFWPNEGCHFLSARGFVFCVFYFRGSYLHAAA